MAALALAAVRSYPAAAPPEAPCGKAVRPSPVAASRALAVASVPTERAGLDLEVRLGPVVVTFPWLERLPIAPRRRIVISIGFPDLDGR